MKNNDYVDANLHVGKINIRRLLMRLFSFAKNFNELKKIFYSLTWSETRRCIFQKKNLSRVEKVIGRFLVFTSHCSPSKWLQLDFNIDDFNKISSQKKFPKLEKKTRVGSKHPKGPIFKIVLGRKIKLLIGYVIVFI